MHKLDLTKTCDALAEWIARQTKDAGAVGAVVGVSGGIDSALTAALCVKGVGEDHTLGMILPCESDPSDARDAELVARTVNMGYKQRDLTKSYNQMIDDLGISRTNYRLVRANLKSRLRMCALYSQANTSNYLVVGTTNLPEMAIGYFTKYGDGAVDIEPLAELPKSEVRALAAHMGIPERIITKPPSAGLWEGQTDEAELGLTYDELDQFSLCAGNVPDGDQAKIEKFIQLSKNSLHKRKAPPTGSPCLRYEGDEE